MADFSALKTSIQNYIKQNGNEEITGNLLQQILLSMVSTLGDSAINDLVTALNNEVSARQNADGTLQTNINNEATARGNADNTLRGLIDGITGDIENGYVYAGIATPSTTPVSGKVFYLALTAGTYTNFGATVVPQGVNILKYNGSAWSLDTFIGLDDAPTQGSNNFVKSGGVIDSIIKDGSAFDLSAYNSGTTYADLSTALAALDTLPAAYKKGGMSVKFVQTSDNKYVQYRLTTDSFSTSVSDWQGVDDVPTVSSKNLVTSDGTKKAIIKDFIHTAEYTPTSTGFNEVVTPFHKGDKVKVKVSGATITDVYQSPTAGSTEGLQIASKTITSDGFIIIASIDFESLWIYFETIGSITIERDVINSDVNIENLSPYIQRRLYIPSVTQTLVANSFNEIPCRFLKGDKVIINMGENTEVTDTYQRPVYGSAEGQTEITRLAREGGYYFVATVDIESILIYCTVAGDIEIRRDEINKTVDTTDLPDHCVTDDKLATDLTNIKAYMEASPYKIFDGVYPVYYQKSLAGEYWATYIFNVQGVSKIKVKYNFANDSYGIAFSTNGETVEAFNNGTISDWWYQYPGTSGEVEINVPNGARYLALAQRDMTNECELYVVINITSFRANKLYGKKCIYIGDSISTADNYKWKGLLEKEYNLGYVRDKSPLSPANGGITLMPPQTESENMEQKSIWYRCAEHRMDIYEFDIISLFGGTNDMTVSTCLVGDVDANGDYIDIARIAPFVDDAASFDVPAAYNDVWSNTLTYAECLMGCIEMLHRDFPSKPIVVCTVMPCGYWYGNYIYSHEGSPMNGVIMSERMAIIAMRIVNFYQTVRGFDNIYGVPFYWGIRTINSVAAFSNWLTETTSIDGVHPNRLCAVKMVNMFKDSLFM